MEYNIHSEVLPDDVGDGVLKLDPVDGVPEAVVKIDVDDIETDEGSVGIDGVVEAVDDPV